jgi:membrane associated rhomboid family serine protease
MIPIGTDAPIYHWPFATVTMMIVNIAAAFLFWGLDEETAREWTLVYGEGLHPLQWLTFNFLHADIIHLVGNMVFLWTFGLIVEGKVGPLVFAAIYLALGVLEGGIVQAAMLGVEGEHAALGASGIICGLIGIGLVWAPHNEVSLLLIYFFGFMLRVRQFDWPIVGFAFLYFVLQVLDGLKELMLMNAAGKLVVATAGLHLIGATLGFALGTLMVKREWVDCEGWDLYTRGLWGKARVEDKKKARKKAKKKAPVDLEAKSAEALANLRAALDDGAALEALASYQYLARLSEGWRPLEPDMLRLIVLLQKQGYTPESLPVMKDYVARFPDKSARVRLKLARILLVDQRRPAAALRVLAAVDDAELTDDLRAVRRRMEQEAHRMRREGELEVEEEPW